MKTIVLGGFLGAGKTSLLLRLLSYLTDTCNRGDDDAVRVAIIENEIGQVSVDGATLFGQGIELREIMSGCVCCSLVGELEDTIKALQQQIDPQWLIVEATGLAYPGKAADAVRAASSNLESCRVYVLVDAGRFLKLQGISPLIFGQPSEADVILLNKVDLVDEQEKTKIVAQLRKANETAPIFELVAAQPLGSDFFKEMLSDD